MERIEQILWPDPQQLPGRRCPRCGGVVYGPGYGCGRCGRERP